jgi:heme/copper-type cytochrome/quinol oxidase subunit 2
MSSLIFLGFSVIAFIISYGIMFTVAPMILGQFFTASDNMPIADAEWAAIYEQNEDTVQFLVPLIPAVGIFVLVIKVLMVASVRGRD